jgi:hypothetical protein
MEQNHNDRYNRQVYAVGEDAQRQLSETRLLICGGGPLGLEVAKNAVLMGVGRVLVYDSHGSGAASVAWLRELNPHVRVEWSDEMKPAPLLVADHNFVIVVGGPLEEAEALDAQCRLARVPFVLCVVRGRSCVVWADFGESHAVYDTDGVEPLSGTLLGVDGGAWEAEEERHGLYSDDQIAVQGEQGARTVTKVLNARTLLLSGSAGHPGASLQFRQLKTGRTVSHAPLTSFAGELRAVLALEEGARSAALESVAAAMAAHEVLKRGGKFSPLDQLWRLDEPVLPQQAMEREQKVLRLLVVGAGAIGCELLKILAQQGELADVTVVDPDCIEQTNLSRQLLFRAGDIGANKARVAAREAEKMSGGKLRVLPVESLLSAASEAALGDDMSELFLFCCRKCF